MSLFKCEKCGCVENTALSLYWFSNWRKGIGKLCSECDPQIGKWHGMFPKQDATEGGYMLGNDGFIYHPEHIASGQLKWREEHQGFQITGPA